MKNSVSALVRVGGGGRMRTLNAAPHISHPAPTALSSSVSHCILGTWDACHTTASGLAQATCHVRQAVESYRYVDSLFPTLYFLLDLKVHLKCRSFNCNNYISGYSFFI